MPAETPGFLPAGGPRPTAKAPWRGRVGRGGGILGQDPKKGNPRPPLASFRRSPGNPAPPGRRVRSGNSPLLPPPASRPPPARLGSFGEGPRTPGRRSFRNINELNVCWVRSGKPSAREVTPGLSAQHPRCPIGFVPPRRPAPGFVRGGVSSPVTRHRLLGSFGETAEAGSRPAFSTRSVQTAIGFVSPHRVAGAGFVRGTGPGVSWHGGFVRGGRISSPITRHRPPVARGWVRSGKRASRPVARRLGPESPDSLWVRSGNGRGRRVRSGTGRLFSRHPPPAPGFVRGNRSVGMPPDFCARLP
jgi:hypothetical protein